MKKKVTFKKFFQFSILLNIWYFFFHLSNIVVHSCIKYPCGSVDIRLGPIGVENFVILLLPSFHAFFPMSCVYFSFIHITFFILSSPFDDIETWQWWTPRLLVKLLFLLLFLITLKEWERNYFTYSWDRIMRVVVWVCGKNYMVFDTSNNIIFLGFFSITENRSNGKIVWNKIKDIDLWKHCFMKNSWLQINNAN